MKPIAKNPVVQLCLLSFLASAGVVVTPSSLFSTSQTIAQTPFSQIIAQISPTQITVTDIKGFAGVIQAIAVSPDGKILLAGTGGETVSAFDLEQEELIYTIPVLINDYSSIAFSPDGKTFAIAEDTKIGVFSTATGTRIRTLQGHPKRVSDVAISPDGEQLVSVSSEVRDIRIWDLKTGNLIETLTEDIGPIRCIDFTPDGKLFITGSIGNDRTIQFWDANTLELVQTSPQQPGYINDLAVSADDKLVAAIRNYVKVWDLSDASVRQNIKGPNLEINTLAISPDSRYVATANKEGTIMIFDIIRGQKVVTLEGHTGWVRTVAFSPDSNYLYSGAEDKVVKVWQLNP
ncbi:MAG: WD40 repeat domain-containing protein [Xenococcaceae cyanobacterium MO_234.B1]|nr:WD40 repeat domain-containing protein [Xenococcaceae cyanobacterium MO_234.B1]